MQYAKQTLFTAVLLINVVIIKAQQSDTVVKPESIILDGVPALKLYNSNENLPQGGVYDLIWHPTKKEMIVSSLTQPVQQLYHIKTPLGNMKQLTFAKGHVWYSYLKPVDGSYILYSQDADGINTDHFNKMDAKTVYADQTDHVRPEQIDHLFWWRRRAVHV